MTIRQSDITGIDTIIQPAIRDFADGLKIRRVLPSSNRLMIGPFILFDHFGPAIFDAGHGFDMGPHPHIGVAAVTYLIDGEIVHRDNFGKVQTIRPGEVNWMTAGSAPEPYSITSLDEASAYLSFPILGGRYRECVGTLQRRAGYSPSRNDVHSLYGVHLPKVGHQAKRLSGLSARAVFGEVDAKKLHASLTLFSEASNDEFLLETIFDVWFDGLLDEETMNDLVVDRILCADEPLQIILVVH